MNPHRALVIAYYWPPCGGPGVQRVLKQVKYLARAGWEVTVLTVNERHHDRLDPSLVAEIPPGVRVLRTRSLEPDRAGKAAAGSSTATAEGRPSGLHRLLAWGWIPDSKIRWLPFALGRAATELRRDPRPVLLSMPPYSVALLGLVLKKFFAVRVIADFRDLWTHNPFYRPPTRWHDRINRRLEKMLFGAADELVTVSDRMADQLTERQRQYGVTVRTTVIENGFDPEDFAGLAPPPPRGDRLAIGYMGSFQGAYSPRWFLEMLRRLKEQQPDCPVRATFAGDFGGGNRDRVRTLGLEAWVELRGYLPHRAALELMNAMDLLLLLYPPDPRFAPGYTGKVFEYLALRKPLLAVVPDGALAELVREHRLGWTVAPEATDRGAALLAELIARWRAGTWPAGGADPALLDRFDRRRQAVAMATLLAGGR